MKTKLLALALLSLGISTAAFADTFGSGSNSFTIPFVPIGNVGNAADSTTYGAVGYNYNISTYAVSQDDINKAVASGFSNGTTGDWTGSKPATTITWYQAAAFANWLNTSQGYTAAYNLDAGAMTLTVWSQSQAFALGAGAYDLYRNANAHYFLPSENEYYKAAYYDPNKGGGRSGWLLAVCYGKRHRPDSGGEWNWSGNSGLQQLRFSACCGGSIWRPESVWDRGVDGKCF